MRLLGKSATFRIPSNDDHDRVSALFLGPKAENRDLLQCCFDLIASKQYEWRQAYFPGDSMFIGKSLHDQPAYKEKVREIQKKLELLLKNLNKWSIPFYSPRYNAHMASDQSLPAILGYLATMFYNPNNVAFEGGPYSTEIELIVGREMCEMMGYNFKKDSNDLPTAWGHICCDGTVANLESIWSSRNLKFHPFSLRDAMAEGKELEFIADSFKIETCNNTTKLLTECSIWELLNLKVSTVLEIPDRLHDEYQMSSYFLDSVMKDYLVQTVGKDDIMARWGIKHQPIIVIPSTKHYSWPKGAALAGIGSKNVINIDVDQDARMSTDQLRDYLMKCAKNKTAVYEVVAVMGTTEEGAVDRLEEIVKIRDDLRKEGLSFVIHADAAWGGYFASMLPSLDQPPSDLSYAPHVGLRLDTATHLRSLKDADSITIDPHKAGYVPYPAGGLCYRDGRMRYLLTWTAPYINHGSTGENIGVYGVEGSKPGAAAAAAVYLSHQVIGTGSHGYGTLLGEASFTCRRFAGHWAAMSDDDTSFIVVPFNRLPSEKMPDSNPKVVNDEKQFIRERVLDVSNSDLVEDDDAMRLLNQLGSDLNINAFACNFRYSDGSVNRNVEEANWLNRRIFERLSVKSPNEDPHSIPFYLSSTVFAQNDYGECATRFKKRLGLKGKQDLFVLRNVVMSPFAMTHDFMRELVDVLRTVLEEEVMNVRSRNEEKPGKHTFLMQGTDPLFLVHLPSFHTASGRRQIILSADISAQGKLVYAAAKKASSQVRAVLHNVDPMLLDDIVDGKAFKGVIELQYEGFSTQTVQVDVSNVTIIKKHSLDAEDFDSAYPALMPFYLYGTQAQPHIDHMLLLAPNTQLSAGSVQLAIDNDTISDADLAKGVIVVAKNLHERAMQPFKTMTPQDVPEGFFFKEGLQMDVTVYRDPFPTSTLDPISLDEVKEVMCEGRITVKGDVYVDSAKLNGDGEIPERRTYSRHDLSTKMSDQTKCDWVDAVHSMHADFQA